MSGESILIEQLRADVERLELDLAAVAMCDSSDCGLCVSCLVKRAEKAERERDEARAERDARPDISAKDAAHAIKFFRGWDDKGSITEKVFSALRAHAAKAVKP